MHDSTKPTFDAQSRLGGACSLSGMPQSTKRKTRTISKQDHELDEFVITLTQIEHEGDFDVLPSSLRALALKYLDLVPESDAEALRFALVTAEEKIQHQEHELEDLKERHDALIAELSYVWTADNVNVA